MARNFRKRLRQYSGPLTAAQIAAGMNGARRNAVRLAQDARVLVEMRRYPSALVLAAVSLEESGKVDVLYGLAIAVDEEERQRCWRDFRTHTKKNVSWIAPLLAKAGACTISDFLPMLDEHAEHPYFLDQIKQLAFYSECLDGPRWSEPDSEITEADARQLVEIAERMLPPMEATAEQLELWIEHIGPVWRERDSLNAFKAALDRYFRELQAQGLS